MKRNFLPAATLAGIALLPCASADVIYSGQLDTSIPINDFNGVDVTINGGTLNFFFGGVGIANDANLQPFRNGTGGLDTILKFNGATVISGTSGLLATGPGGSQDHLGTTFTAGQEGYIGFKLNGTDFGWARVVLTNNAGGAVVKDWAYNTGGGSIATGNVIESGSTFTLDSSAQSFTLGSAITDSNSVVKTGVNTVTLSGSNSYTGTTSIDAGTLALGASGSIADSGTITVGQDGTLNVSALTGGWTLGSSQTLTGSGGVTGDVTIEGTHNAGDPGSNSGVGSQAVDGNLTYASGSIFEWDLTSSVNADGVDTDGVAGTNFDSVSVTGNIDVTSGAIFKVIFGGDALTDVQNMGNAFWNTPYGTQTWNMSAIFGKAFYSGAFTSVTTSTDVSAYGSFSISGSQLTWTAVPEPTTALAGLLLTAGLLRRRRA